MKTYLIKVYGRVQGVGFRYFITQLAEKINLKGTIKNNSDRSVSIVAQVDDKELDTLIEKIEEGNMISRVNCIDVELIDIETEYKSFDVIY